MSANDLRKFMNLLNESYSAPVVESEEIEEELDEAVAECEDEELDEAVIEETGNANAQQKGINFSGTPAKKNSGDMDLSSPKSKGPGSKTPLAQAKSGTNVGQKKA